MDLFDVTVCSMGRMFGCVGGTASGPGWWVKVSAPVTPPVLGIHCCKACGAVKERALRGKYIAVPVFDQSRTRFREAQGCDIDLLNPSPDGRDHMSSDRALTMKANRQWTGEMNLVRCEIG